MLKFNNLSRRQLLEKVGGASAIPFLWPLMPRVEAAEAEAASVVRRYTYWGEFVMPQRNLVDEMYQNDEGPIKFRGAYSPLNNVSEKMLFLRDMRRPNADNGDGPHPSGVAGISGWKGGGPGKYRPETTSLDQVLAQKYSNETLVSDLRPGHNNFGKDGDYNVSISVVKGKPQGRYKSPVAMYDDLFKNLQGNSGGGGKPSEALLRRQSVMDSMTYSLNKLNKQVSHFDRQKIESHVSAIREVEKEITKLADGSAGAECGNGGAPGKVGPHEDFLYPAYTKLMVRALACNMTRVAGTHFGSAACNIGYQFLASYKGGGGKKYHSSTHGKHSGAGYIRDVLEFRAQTVANYLSELDSVVEPDGTTLLDNTILMWTTDVARDHNNKDDIHMILAGGLGAGGFKNHGNMKRLKGSVHNDVLCSIANYMGHNVDSFGDPAFCNGTLPGSVFG